MYVVSALSSATLPGGVLRSILEFKVRAYSGSTLDGDIDRSLADSGWTEPDLGLTRDDLVFLARDVITRSSRAGRDRPTSPESAYIKAAINARFGLDARAKSIVEGPSRVVLAETRFASGTYERNCLEQAILILTQIAEADQSESFLREMRVIVSPEYKVYGLLFAPVPTDRPHGSEYYYEARLRCSDLSRLQAATTSFISALSPTKRMKQRENFGSVGASVTRERRGATSFKSSFSRLEIRSVTSERIFEGSVVPISGRFSLFRNALRKQSALPLAMLSVLFIIASAALFALAPEEGWWNWSEQMAGRLATAAFGALLVDAAIEYSALRAALMAGSGPVTHGAIVNWKRIGA